MFNMGYDLEQQRSNKALIAEVQHRIEQFKQLPIPALYECASCDYLV